MKRAIILIVVLVTSAAVVALQTLAREWQYRALLSQGDAALRDDQTFGAIEAYSGAAAVRPDSMLARLRRGEAYARHGELEAAVKDFRAASNLDPTAIRPLEELAGAFYDMRRFGPAAETYHRAFQLDDRAGRLAYKWALASYRRGDVDEALAAVAQATHLPGATSESFHLLALCARDKGRAQEAERALRTAVELSPQAIGPREDLADLLGSRNRRAEQLDELRELARMDRGHVERWIEIAMAQARAGQTDAAILTLTNALKGAPDNDAVYLAMARIWLDVADATGDRVALDKGLEALRRVPPDTNETTSSTLTTYGRALLLSDQLDRAEEMLSRAVDRYPLDPAAFALLARIAERRGLPETAQESLVAYKALVSPSQVIPSLTISFAKP